MSTDTLNASSAATDDDEPASRFDRIGQRLSDDAELARTVVYAAVGLTLLVLACVVALAIQPPTLAEYDDVGEAFYPEFDDASQAAGIRVAAWNDTSSRVEEFEVKREADGWVIPTHSNYPADGEDELARAATSMLGIERDARFEGGEDVFERYDLVDPLDTGYVKLKGRGRRVSLTDRAGDTLADYIVGKEVDPGSGTYYVRRPDEDRIYIAKLDLDVSTRFGDWVEADLLDIDEDRLVELTIENQTLNERTGQIDIKDRSRVTRPTPADEWTINDLPEGGELDTASVDDITRELADLELIGVRRKAPAIAKLLAGEGDGTISRRDSVDLEDRGYYITRDGQLVSLEGQLSAGQDDGLVYILKFGRSFTGSAVDIETGSGDAAASTEDGEESDADGESDDLLRGRYVFVQPVFDPALLPPLPEEPTQPADDADDEAKTAYEEEMKAFRLAKADRGAKLKAGEKRVVELSKRFADWYYVVPAEVFETLAMQRSELIELPEDEADATENDSPDGSPAPPSEPAAEMSGEAANDAAAQIEALAAEAASGDPNGADAAPALPDSISDQLIDFVNDGQPSGGKAIEEMD